MAADMLVTPAELEAYTGSTIPVETATLLIGLATGVVQATIGQRLVQDTSTAVLYVDESTAYLSLPQSPVQSVLSVDVDGEPVTDAVLRRQRLWRPAGWRCGQTVDVTFVHGYPADSTFLGLAKTIVLSLVASTSDNPSGAVQSEAIDDYRVTYLAALTPSTMPEPARQALITAYGRSAYVT